jgi:hypothetical protein
MASALALALAFALAAEARAATLLLSNASSDPAVAAEELDGLLEVAVSGGKTQRLTLTLSNETAAPGAYSIDAILFNASDAVLSVALDRVSSSRGGTVTSAWSLVASTGPGGATDAGRLGLFDYALVTTGAGVAPGDVLTVRIDVAGVGKLATEDFVQASRIEAGEIPAHGAGRFAAGATRVYGGAHAPEPGSLALLLGGLLLLALARRRTPRAAFAPVRAAARTRQVGRP